LRSVVEAQQAASAGSCDNDGNRALCRNDPATARGGAGPSLLEHHGCQDKVASRTRRVASKLSAQET
jgi:hypothetical protein